MTNEPGALSQSETMKYFEGIIMSNNCFFANIFFFIKQLKDGTATLPVRPKEQEGCFLVRDDLKPKTKQKTLEVKTNILSRFVRER